MLSIIALIEWGSNVAWVCETHCSLVTLVLCIYLLELVVVRAPSVRAPSEVLEELSMEGWKKS